MGSLRVEKRAWRGLLVALGLAALLGLLAAPGATAAEPAATATMLVLGVDAPRAGVPFDVTATVQAVPPATGTPQGTIELSLDGEPQGSAALGPDGSATFSIEVDAAGSHELEAQYSGDAEFAPSSTQSVFAADTPPDPGSNLPSRPQLPRGAEPPPAPPVSEPTSVPAASSQLPIAAPATQPTDLAFTGAFALPGLLLGLSSIGLGLGCRRYARRTPSS